MSSRTPLRERRSSHPLAHARREDAELVAVLRHRAAGDLHAAFLQDVDDGLVGQRVLCVSSSTSFWICALMPRAETSSPPVVDSPDEKKYLSGSTPRGVWTNFSFVTRLTVDSCMLITSATSRSVSGFRNCTPFSKKSRCRSTM